MKVTVTCRHEAIGEAAREYVQAKADRVARFFDNLQKIEVILDGAKDHRYTAEMIVSAPRGHVIVCHAEAGSATAAFDESLDKMERQLTKMKQKMRSNTARQAERATRRIARRAKRETTATRDENTGELWW